MNDAGRSAQEPPAAPVPGDSAPALPGPFQIKDCALVALAAGRRAQSLRELRDGLEVIDPASIYYHFWGARLRPRFDDPEYQNDFAAWAHHALHDGAIAERLGVIDPTDFDNLEDLRRELMDVIDERLDESEALSWVRADQQFRFLTSQIVVFDTKREITEARDLADAVASMSPSSIFYHVIDARRRTPDSLDDFRAWLLGFGEIHLDLCLQIAGIDPFFSTLTELRESLAGLLRRHFAGGR